MNFRKYWAWTYCNWCGTVSDYRFVDMEKLDTERIWRNICVRDAERVNMHRCFIWVRGERFQ
jgi:hypothetical protein